MNTLKTVAFIPARSGSKRLPDKNIKTLNNHPLMAYSIQSAIDSKLFDSVICATDSPLYAEIAQHYGAEVPFLRSNEISNDFSPDIEWVTKMLSKLKETGREFDLFCILRPTSPFRTSSTIIRAWNIFIKAHSVDSLRAIEKCTQHPGKMWVKRGEYILPLFPFVQNDTPWHSSQYASLPEIFIQNACLEIAWTKLPIERGTIAGEIIVPFLTDSYEGLDVNYEADFFLAEQLIKSKNALIQIINTEPYNFKKK